MDQDQDSQDPTQPTGANPPTDGGTQPPAGGQTSGDQGAAPADQTDAATPPSAQGAGTGDAGTQGAGTGDAGAQGDDTGAQPAGEESFLRPRPPDSELGIGGIGDFKTTVVVPEHPNTTFDEAYFLKMLSGSISLTKNEKQKIVQSIPKLSQYQIDELIKIFEEERRKFSELDEKHQVKIRELQSKQAEDWKDLEMVGKQEEQKGEDEAAAAALREQLMGGNAPKADDTSTEKEGEEPPAAAAA